MHVVRHHRMAALAKLPATPVPKAPQRPHAGQMGGVLCRAHAQLMVSADPACHKPAARDG